MADIRAVGPGGDTLGPAHVVVWNRPQPGRGVFMRAIQAPTITFSAANTPGVYQVKTRVTDRVAGVTLNLSSPVDRR